MKEICNPHGENFENCQIEELKNKSPLESAEVIADHFASVSQSYCPVDFSSLPCYLPSPPPPKVTEMDVLKKLKKLKATPSTQPLDLPFKLRKEYEYFLHYH